MKMKELKEYLEYIKNSEGVVYEEDGRFKVRQINEDTETLRMFKNIPRELNSIVEYGKKFSKILLEKVDAKPVEFNTTWNYYEYKGNKYYITSENLIKIVSAISIGVKPLLYGTYGTGKTVISRSILAKMFDREPVYVRLHGTPTVEEMVGEIDPIQTYFFVEILKSVITSSNEKMRLEVEKINNGYAGIIDKMTKYNIKDIDSDARELIKELRLMSITAVNLGIALIENRPVVLDEIDKLNNIALNFFGSILQQIDPEIQLPGLGMVEFKQPIITISNTLSINEFIRSRIEEIHQQRLPPEILFEMLKEIGISDEVSEESIKEYAKMLKDNVADLGTRKIIQRAMRREIEKELEVFF